MVYSNKFVMCVLINGHPQKELANGVVPIPFGTEYVLRFRNKNNRRAVVQIYIDGENVSGAGYIVNANDYVDIKRHHDVDRAFKFVSLDSEDAIDHGKNGTNDDKVKGTIEARFFLEKESPKIVYRDVHHYHHHEFLPNPIKKPLYPYWNNDVYFTCDSNQSQTFGACDSLSGNAPLSFMSCNTEIPSKGMSSGIVRSCSLGNHSPVPENLQDGCTVEGHITGQNFRTVWCDTESNYTAIKIFLQGYEEEPVVNYQTTKKRKTNKDNRIDDLEEENERLRKQIEELKAAKQHKKQKEAAKEQLLKEQNEKLKKELEELSEE